MLLGVSNDYKYKAQHSAATRNPEGKKTVSFSGIRTWCLLQISSPFLFSTPTIFFSRSEHVFPRLLNLKWALTCDASSLNHSQINFQPFFLGWSGIFHFWSVRYGREMRGVDRIRILEMETRLWKNTYISWEVSGFPFISSYSALQLVFTFFDSWLNLI